MLETHELPCPSFVAKEETECCRPRESKHGAQERRPTVARGLGLPRAIGHRPGRKAGGVLGLRKERVWPV